MADRLLFLRPAGGAAQNISLLALWYRHLLHLYFGPYSRPIILQQLRFELLHLAARRARQVLAGALADGAQILFTDNAAVKNPDPTRLAILAFHHAQNGFHRRHVASVTVERFVTEGESFVVHNQSDHYLLAVGPMIARIAAAHHRILLRRAFHIGAGQVVKQHVELGSEQGAVALLQVPLQLCLVRQNAVQAAIQTRVVDLALVDLQKIVQGGCWIPALLNGQFAARCAQPIDRQQRRHARPGHIGRLVIDRLFEEAIQFQSLP